jgi:hypothetical protein
MRRRKPAVSNVLATYYIVVATASISLFGVSTFADMDILPAIAQASHTTAGIVVAGPYIISGTAMLGMVSIALKIGTWMGEFKSFKERYDVDQKKETELVTRKEFEMSVKHIDQRFDELGQQIQEIRRLKIESLGRTA